ncbi:unnamed protein product [Soboliphyme baturini]|uniref:SMB domain-containing protein n=1 Tax=Soboliphyme baturini TaxID=241478 RepID=A0A183J8K6_9BILA|nr:unnamed protein product [Soboliphyme baturini]
MNYISLGTNRRLVTRNNRLQIASTQGIAKMVIATLYLFCLLCTLLSYTSAVGFDGIPGDYCAVRQPEQCCVNRDDECTARILDNHLCYCDTFCKRGDGNDCCPDYRYICEGIKPEPTINEGKINSFHVCHFDSVKLSFIFII